jgi:hypothetical protein
MLSVKQVKMMHEAIDEARLQREWNEWKARQRLAEQERQRNIISYRRGWWYRSLGALRESCGNEAEQAGWDASNEAHPAMVKIGIRTAL